MGGEGKSDKRGEMKREENAAVNMETADMR